MLIASNNHSLSLSFIVLGYAVILVAVIAIGLFAANNTSQLRNITQDLYAHPFAVSNAAADLKSDLYQMRNHLLQTVLVSKDKEYAKKKMIVVEELYKDIKADLDVIKVNFLGDMVRVNQMETTIDLWFEVHKPIFAAAQKGDFKLAEQMLINHGAPRFTQIVPHVDYVLEFSQNKAKEFSLEAHRQSESIITQTKLVLTLLALLVVATGALVIWQVNNLQKELSKQAMTDFLTGIPNRRYFLEMTERELSRSKRYGNKFILAVADLDLFKQVNDSYGHEIGDIVLKRFCEICLRTLRDTDIFGRTGGEEFAIALPNASLSEAREVLERLRAEIEREAIKIQPDTSLKFTASFGLAELTSKSDDLNSLFRCADVALYRAKAEGRNKVCSYKPSDTLDTLVFDI